MSQVSDEQLMSACDHLRQDRQQSANLDEPSDAVNRHGLTRTEKFGPVYWNNYPLNSAQDARRWWADRMSSAANETPSRQYEVIDHTSTETNATSEHVKTALQEADTSEFRSHEPSPSVESPRLSVAQQDDCDARVDERSGEESTRLIHQEAEINLEQTPPGRTGYQNSRDPGGYESAYLW